MLKSLYGFLFNNKDHTLKPIPTIDQVFTGEDIRNPPPLLVDTPVINIPVINNVVEPMHVTPSAPLASIKSTPPTHAPVPNTLVWSSTQKRWVEYIPPVVAQEVSSKDESGIEIINAKVIEEEVIQVQITAQPSPTEQIIVKTEETALIKPITDLKEFKEAVTDHIVVQRQKYEERLRQEELIKAKMPKRELRKWTPNNELKGKYEEAAEAVGKVPSLLKKVKQHQEKIASKRAELDKIMKNRNELNPFDKFEIIDYKTDISTEESKIGAIELDLENAQKYIDDPVFEEYALYITDAEQYLKEVGLSGIMSTNDILSSNSIYVKVKSLMDSLKYGKKNQALMDRLQLIFQLFDMKEVHENSRGKNMKGFSDFFIADKSTDPLYLFDRLDIQAIGDSTTMKSITCGPAGGMVDQTMINQNSGMITETSLDSSELDVDSEDPNQWDLSAQGRCDSREY